MDEAELNQFLDQYFLEKAVKNNSPLLIDATTPMFSESMRAHGHKKKRCSRIRDDKYLHMRDYYSSVPEHFIHDGFQITELDEPEPSAWHPADIPEDDDDNDDDDANDHNKNDDDHHNNGNPDNGDGYSSGGFHPDDYLSDDYTTPRSYATQNGFRDNSIYAKERFAAPAAMATEDVVESDLPSEGTFHTLNSQFARNGYQGFFQGESSALEMSDSFYLIPDVPPPEDALDNMDYVPSNFIPNVPDYPPYADVNVSPNFVFDIVLSDSVLGRKEVASPVSQSSSSIAIPQSPSSDNHIVDSFQETHEYYSTPRKHPRSAEHESDADSDTTVDSHMMKVRKCTSDTDAGTLHKKNVLLRYTTRKCQRARMRGSRNLKKVANKTNAPNAGPWRMAVEMDYILSSEGHRKRRTGHRRSRTLTQNHRVNSGTRQQKK
ncbi:OLC1v1020329C1 [Oldenlandia corymbosa var. corymbosa]|uniref:OLC1v1020329C1 n=1 Tax=Oldenlandia corymbosa var. corymbosa TaxID=529605 RepID=A0AAV1EG69_OLDCO|nr:OLC1v1020329C1 [Oldenlandia corymbosa var. corymbosa]